MSEITEIASGLRFPEGPIAMPDGSVVLVEIERQTLSRISATGDISVIANLGGGPNGAAIGPDGRCYVCNNGGFRWHYGDDGSIAPTLQDDQYTGGSIQAVDLATGKFETLYTATDRGPLRGPNDIVFDDAGGFWFTDLGKTRERDMDRGFVCYAKTDGTECREVIRAMVTPNGVGLSPDEKTLYAAETLTGRVWAWQLSSPGKVNFERTGTVNRGHLLVGLPGYQEFDSLAVDAGGYVCVATLQNGGITAVSPDGKDITHYPMPDHATTNICFGGPDLQTAFVTLSTTGRLVSMQWPRPGLALNYLNK
ncbi:MAG: SMP-30/gluconolactonase/LRE family protein [Gammaproteobacteria bacterium]|nr:SMP-30/gluconolactonase/LRE family protein [Gammaproteobacteria bacterium]